MTSRTLVRTLSLAAAAASLAAAPGARAQDLPPAGEIVARYVAAIGGEAAITANRHRHFRGEMSMPAAGMTMRMEMWQARPDRMLMVMEIPGMGEMRQGYDGEVAWRSIPMQGASILEGAEREQLVQQADFDANLRFEHAFPEMETVGRGEMQGRPCFRVRMQAESGEEAVGCFDVESGLLLGLTSSSVTEMGPVESTVEFHDYREFGGLRMPSRTVISAMGQEMVMTVTEMDTEPFPDSTFDLPADVAALR